MTTKETMEEGAEASQQAENEAKKEIEETGEIPLQSDFQWCITYISTI